MQREILRETGENFTETHRGVALDNMNFTNGSPNSKLVVNQLKMTIDQEGP